MGDTFPPPVFAPASGGGFTIHPGHQYSPETQSITSPGVYEVLMRDGGTRELLVMFAGNDDLVDGSNCPKSTYDAVPPLPPNLVLVDPSTRHSLRLYHYDRPAIYGRLVREFQPSDFTAPQAGKAYRVYHAPTRSCSDPLYVKAVQSTEHGQTELTVTGPCLTTSHPGTLTINPDYDGYAPAERVLGKPCKFIEVAFEKEKPCEGSTNQYVSWLTEIPLGSVAAVNQFIFEQGYKRATVVSRPNGSFRIQAASGTTGELQKLAAVGHLMVKLSVDEATAEHILGEAAQRAGRDFAFFHAPLPEKQATNLRFPQFPEFLDTANSEFGVPQGPQDHQIMTALGEHPYQERHRLGDAVQHPALNTNDSFATATPMQLYQQSLRTGKGSLFEHGVVGELVQTYDSLAMVDKWLPDLERALDRVGRLLFLFYWKPEDFAKAYGTDDQAQLENKLVSQFKSLGDLVLELLQKSRQLQQGSQ